MRAGIDGSPPRAWGIPIGPHYSARQFRFTPTCVGNTCGSCYMRVRLTVHPHVRGEYIICVCHFPDSIGSPPRAWGIRFAALRRNLNARFTPTCVGNTKDPDYEKIMETVHPHVRGEYVTVPHTSTARTGSPPRAWGIRICFLFTLYLLRFTPTCVGNTSVACSSMYSRSVHPHVRGEYAMAVFCSSETYGSPPRAWGIRRGSRRHLFCIWFTPTCVGNTYLGPRASYNTSVHPHVRGEYYYFGTNSIPKIGSPPRAWGIRARASAISRAAWFTPTCVGNTTRSFSPSPRMAVHPHVRGEYLPFAHKPFGEFGSPPRAWGIPIEFIGILVW